MQRSMALKHSRQNFFAGLNQTLGPTCLLGFECGHLYRQFGRALHILQVDEFPALELRPIVKIGIFSQCVVLASAGFFYRSAPPHAGRTVEIEKDPAARAARMFEYEVAVEQNGLHLSQE